MTDNDNGEENHQGFSHSEIEHKNLITRRTPYLILSLGVLKGHEQGRVNFCQKGEKSAGQIRFFSQYFLRNKNQIKGGGH